MMFSGREIVLYVIMGIYMMYYNVMLLCWLHHVELLHPLLNDRHCLPQNQKVDSSYLLLWVEKNLGYPRCSHKNSWDLRRFTTKNLGYPSILATKDLETETYLQIISLGRHLTFFMVFHMSFWILPQGFICFDSHCPCSVGLGDQVFLFGGNSGFLLNNIYIYIYQA